VPGSCLWAIAVRSSLTSEIPQMGEARITPCLKRRISRSSIPRGCEAVLLWQVGSLTESGQCLTQKPNAGCRGWLVPDKLVEMMICKVSWQLCRSSPLTIKRTPASLPTWPTTDSCRSAAQFSILRLSRFAKPPAIRPSTIHLLPLVCVPCRSVSIKQPPPPPPPPLAELDAGGEEPRAVHP
jgi:hypothetical protein